MQLIQACHGRTHATNAPIRSHHGAAKLVRDWVIWIRSERDSKIVAVEEQ